MELKYLIRLSAFAFAVSTHAQPLEPKPPFPGLEAFQPIKAPKAPGLVLKRGDRLAICGDSITEQKMYSRIMEDYLTVCVPELDVTVRQYGWSGERAPGFLGRMTNDCLRFEPTIATTCYGMNDHEYKPYEERIGRTYREKSMAIIDAFKAHNVRVIQGSAGCIGKMPTWVKGTNGTVTDLNWNLCMLRNIGIDIARQEKVGFADVFWPMLLAGYEAKSKYGQSYAIAGGDGVHPGWAGHTIMAYAFLKAMGLDGNIGVLTVDLKSNKAKGSAGHEVLSSAPGELSFRSSRYPFCLCAPDAQSAAGYPVCSTDDPAKDNSILSAATLVPFQKDLNRFMLMVRGARSGNYKVTWGARSKTFSADDLKRGVNLAAEFPENPFSENFSRVDVAVIAKQKFETRQIKEMFHGAEGRKDMDGVAARTEKEHAELAAAIKAAFVPVTHTIRISPE
jgi:hypothetical protein